MVSDTSSIHVRNRSSSGPTGDANRAEDESYRYFAFLSYSHADNARGIRLHGALEKYKIPDRLRKDRRGHPLPLRLYPIFRDRDELASSASLSADIREALDGARHLIVVCSPAAARSAWVNEEILHFRKRGLASRILCYVVGGEIGAAARGLPAELECIPPALGRELWVNEAHCPPHPSRPAGLLRCQHRSFQ